VRGSCGGKRAVHRGDDEVAAAAKLRSRAEGGTPDEDRTNDAAVLSKTQAAQTIWPPEHNRVQIR